MTNPLAAPPEAPIYQPPAASSSQRPTLRTQALRLLIVAAGLGLWANTLFIKQPLGLSAPLFAVTVLLALFGLAAWGRIAPAWRNAWLAAPLLYFAIMVAVRASEFTTFLNVCAAVLLAGLLAHLFTGGNIFTLSVTDYVVQSLTAGFEICLIRPIQALELSGRESQSATKSVPSQMAAVLRGVALAIPVLIVFTALFISADAAFNQAVFDVLKALSLDNAAELVLRLFFAAVVAWACLGGLAYAFRANWPLQAAIPTGGPLAIQLGFTETAIILGSVNLLFAAFVGVQFRYFFGGQSNITVAGFTYSDYARRGFGELVVVAVFALGLGLLLQILTPRRQASARWGFDGLVFVLVALTGIILASAFQRLQLYEEAYGFTELRTYSHVFMIWVGALLGVFVVTVLIDRPRLFVFGTLMAGLGFVATLNILNTDAFVAQQNISRYRQTGKLDAQYLARLSDDAIPELLPLLDTAQPAERKTLGTALPIRLDELDALQAKAGWSGWNWARSRAYQSLAAHRAALVLYVIPSEE
jgi:hypothetical protein